MIAPSGAVAAEERARVAREAGAAPMAIDESPSFATLLSRYRLAARLTQEGLAERASLSARAISDLERGLRRSPQPLTVRQLADALGLGSRERTLFEAAGHSPRTNDHEAPATPVRPVGDFLGALPDEALVARDEELARLRAILDTVAGGSGRMVLLAGDRGAGKTRLAQEVLVVASARGFAVGTGRCYQTERTTALYPMLDALEELAAMAPTALRADLQPRLQAVQDLLPTGDEPGGQRGLGGLAAHLLLTLAERIPVALLLDDLQWADARTVRLLASLAHATRGAPVLLLGTVREGGPSEDRTLLAHVLQDLSRERLLEQIAVRRLMPEETAALVAVLMGHAAVSEEFAAFVHRRSKGNARLVEQLVRALGGRLALRREIGAGAMGRVFEAVDTRTGQIVAAKLMLARGETDPETLMRVQQEGAVLAALSHPNIVRIYETFAEEHASCIIMELLDGSSLGQILLDGPLPLPRARRLAMQMAAALSYAHAQGIVHRDIKPDNIMVLEHDQVKVTDFGIARLLPSDIAQQTIATTGMRPGTPHYMAPEQIAGKKVDGRTDIYAFGGTLFHMVTGRPPFEGDDALAVAVRHLQDEPAPASALNPTVPADWDALLRKALAKEPARRFQSAKELVRAIAALGEVGVPVRGAARRRRAAAGATLVAVLVVAMLAVWLHVASAGRPATLGATIDAYLSGLEARQQFSGSVLVARHGTVALEQGYGMADRLYRRPNTPTTTYPAFGVSDSFSVLGVLHLIQQGKLAWQTPICRYLPSCPRSWMPITARMVLDGTAGLPDYSWGSPGATTQWSIERCQALPLAGRTGRPGSAMRFGSCDTLVLGTIIEQVSQEVWESSLVNGNPRAYDIKSTWRLTDALATSVAARAYDGADLDPNTVYNDYYEAYTTAHDIYAYDNALFGGKLLSPPYLTSLFAPRAAAGQMDPGIAPRGIGYLWRTGTAFGRRVIYTDAANNSFSIINLRFPEAGATIVVISNESHDDAEGIALHAAALALGRAWRDGPR